MEILHGLPGLRQLPARSVLSIGNFDGVHLGHRHILSTARDIANAGGGVAQAVITFEPHPLTVLRPKLVPPRLTPPEFKQELLREAGVEFLCILPPEPEVLGLSAEKFWEILRDEIRAAWLVEGSTFRFGKGAAGSVDKLKIWTAGTQTQLRVVDSVQVALLNLQVIPVSSSAIRFLLDTGRVRDAAIALGRPHRLIGTVVKGFERGRKLGFPTANLKCENLQVPADGVYAGRCAIDGRTYPAAVSIGSLPTFTENVYQIEAHLIDFNGDLYGKSIGVELLDWLREQIKFSGIEALKSQLHRDITLCRAMVDTNPSRPIAVVA